MVFERTSNLRDLVAFALIFVFPALNSIVCWPAREAVLFLMAVSADVLATSTPVSSAIAIADDKPMRQEAVVIGPQTLDKIYSDAARLGDHSLIADHFAPVVCGNCLPEDPIDVVAIENNVAIAKSNIHTARMMTACGGIFVDAGKTLIVRFSARHSRDVFAPSCPDSVSTAGVG